MPKRRPLYALASLLLPLAGLAIAFLSLGRIEEPIDPEYTFAYAMGAVALFIRATIIFLFAICLGFVCGFVGLVRKENRALSISGMVVTFTLFAGIVFLFLMRQ